MTALHVTNTVNVEATLNQWIQDEINALDKPAWLPTFVFVFDAPETTLILPAFSVYHLPVSAVKSWNGVISSENVSLMEVSCWVTRGNTNWSAQLRAMRAYVDQIFAANRTAQISNYLSDPANPVAVSYKIDIQRVEWNMVIDDPNPDIERARALIRYRWIQRS